MQSLQVRIVETEAYKAPEDKACHAHLNRRTKRTETMFLTGGHLYIYKCYGTHHMLNLVTGPEGKAHAILIRAVEPISGLDVIKDNREMMRVGHQLIGGPGKVCQALGIDDQLDKHDATRQSSVVRIYDDGYHVPQKAVVSTSRVGLSALTGESQHWPWRFYDGRSSYVSRPLIVKY